MMSDERDASSRADAAASASAGRARMSPKARRLAREHGIEPAHVRGSGADGEILADDVFRAVAAAARERADAERARAAHLAEEARLEQQRRSAAENARIEHERVAAEAAAAVARLERERVAAAAASADRERALLAEVEASRVARASAESDAARAQAQRARFEAESTNLASERLGIEAERARLETERAALEAHRARLETERAAVEASRNAPAAARQDTTHDFVPQIVVRRDVDALALVTGCERLNARTALAHSAPLSHIDVIVTAVARALRQHPQVNAHWRGGAAVPDDAINIALAIATGDDDVVMPVIREADRTSLSGLAQRRQDLVARAESRRLQPPDLADATFTISYMDRLSVDELVAPVVPPQACHLAVGAVADRVIAIDGLIGVRPTISLTLSCDDRIVHAPRAAAFLNDVAIALSEPHDILDS